MRSLVLATALLALCAVSMATPYSGFRKRSADNETRVPDNTTAILRADLKAQTENLTEAISRSDLVAAAEAGKNIADNVTFAEKKELVDPKDAHEVKKAVTDLKAAAATGNEVKAAEAAKVVTSRAEKIEDNLTQPINHSETRQKRQFEREKSAIEQFQSTMQAMRWALRRSRLHLASKYAKNAAKSASWLGTDRFDNTNNNTNTVATQMDTLANDMASAADRGDVEGANEIADQLTNLAEKIVPSDNATTDAPLTESTLSSNRTVRSASAEQPLPATVNATTHDKILSNVTQQAAATLMSAENLRLDETAKSAAELEKVADNAEQKGVIEPAKAAEIKEVAQNVKEAAKIGDVVGAAEQALELNKKIDEVMVENKGQDLEQKLQSASSLENMPVISSEKDVEDVKSVAKEIVNKDLRIPTDKKEEAAKFVTEMTIQALEKTNATNGKLVTAVEAQVVKQNLTGNSTAVDASGLPISPPVDSDGRIPRHFGFHRRFRYHPFFNYGFGFRQCLYSPLSYWGCRRYALRDFIYHTGFHSLYY